MSPDYKYDAAGPVATSLPPISAPYVTFSGAIPPFFTNLLPEGRRLSNLKRKVKASLGRIRLGTLWWPPRTASPSERRSHRPGR
ncbi:HipA N-terminal domain-containing protein [Corynebacterium tuscaniense]|uniref:HipA N-terminal domain-containing protein n=1 Tax=Corynebacterium tuscaniense TaxID=302449 RepID=UPI002013118E|nr:HipA N-terminal domain-containing protein [Corynebacterium tuscaniense]